VTTDIDAKILKKLEILEEKEGTLPGSLEFYRKLLLIQFTAKQRIDIPRFSLSPEVVNERIVAGRPLLEFDNLSINWLLFRDIFKEASILFSSYSNVWVEIAGNLKGPDSFFKRIARDWFEGTRLHFMKTTDGTSEALWASVIHTCLKPFLVSHREDIYHLIKQEFWRRNYCPICGGSPDFAFLDKERGARWLLCSQCDAEWLFQRLECPYCSTENQNSLAHFTDDKGFYRLYVCEECQGYLKAIDLRKTEDEVLLPLERFLTTDLDIQAQQNGYKLPESISRCAVVKEGS
jgi:hypothetical protein